MKTRKTILVVAFLLLAGFTINASQRNTEISKLHFLQLKNASLVMGISNPQLKLLSLKENQLSVPGKSVDYTWNEETKLWEHTSNTAYTYNPKGDILEEVVQEAGTGHYLTRESTKYDHKGNITEEISYIMGDTEWLILTGEKTQYSYDDHGNLTEEIKQIWHNGAWENKSKDYYTLNGSGIPTEFHASEWDGARWVDYSRTILLVWHNWQKKQLAGYTIQYWKEGMKNERYTAVYEGDNYTGTTEVQENDKWVNSKRQIYTHTNTEEANISETWENSAWKKDEKFVSTFDASGNPTGFQYSSWADNNWSLDIRYFFDLAYDNQNNVTQMTVRYWDPELEAPENVLKFDFSDFLHFTTDIPDMNKLSSIKAFPNPVKNALSISINDANIKSYQVNITDLAGKTIYQDTFSSSSATINTEQFIRGMYVLSIRTADGKSHQSKVFKQ